AARCSRPKDVANAHIDVGNGTFLNTHLRYTCNPGYKRKAGTSSLIQCVLHDGSSEPDWTPTTLQCIRDPALRSQPTSPELPTTSRTDWTTQRGTTDGSSKSSSSSPGLLGAADGPSPGMPVVPEMPSPREPSTPGEGTALGTSLEPTPLPTAPTDHAAGLPVLVVAGVVACCCWRIKT
ncbi:PREDICTED: interleukin-15 receptor subunit alpha, partial [Apaloderma vittatum]|uniref:interleukin-15 receptor subunit alpha n=1 Tax=Apaloderma vittatum TaxID=57397 RepID=UPI0005216C46